MIAIVIYVAIILVYAWIRKCDAYDAFIRGAKEGVLVSDKIFPPLLAFIISVNIFTKSGITEALGRWITSTGVPPEIILQMFIRPLSGNSSMVLMTKVFEIYGVDSLYGKMASLIQGTSDTTLYVVSFYLGSVAIKDSRYALKAGLLINLLSYIIVLIICFLLFS
jgi:spore maturation protein B